MDEEHEAPIDDLEAMYEDDVEADLGDAATGRCGSGSVVVVN